MTCGKRARCSEVSWRHLRGSSWLLGCSVLGLAACGPPWWRKGRPRKVRICAEVELLSRLAELLMPQTPIGELFRDFPAGPSREPQWLSPGIAAFGVLEDEGAALFVEYDKTDRNSDEQAENEEQLKTKALLQYAPAGSRVLRIGHRAQDFGGQQKSVDAIVNVWREGHKPSLMKAVSQSVWVLLSSCDIALREDVHQNLHRFAVTEPKPCLRKACEFSTKALLASEVKTKKANVMAFLEEHLDFSQSRSQALVDKFPRLSGMTVDGKLKPIVAWLEDVGLSRKQVAKVVAGFPAFLGYSLEANLKPTVAWLGAVGLSRERVANVVATYPQVLGCSLEDNLKPTLTWLEDVGLSRAEVAKAISGSPKILSYSVKDNLKPTVAWLQEIGLSPSQVAKAVAGLPSVLGLSVEANLKPTVGWLEDLGLSRKEVAKVVAASPQVLGLSIEANLKPMVAWLEEVGLRRPQVAKVLRGHPSVLRYGLDSNLKPAVAWLEDVGLSREQVARVVASSPSVLGYSIEASLKPKVAWLEDLGLSRQQVAKVVAGFPSVLCYSIGDNLNEKITWLEDGGLSRKQVAKVIARFPAILGYSIDGNLSQKRHLLQKFFSKEEMASMIERHPPILGYSYARLFHRLEVLQEHNCLSKLPSMMPLTDAKFERRFCAERCGEQRGAMCVEPLIPEITRVVREQTCCSVQAVQQEAAQLDHYDFPYPESPSYRHTPLMPSAQTENPLLGGLR